MDPILFVIAGIVALVWGGLLLARGGLTAGCMAVLVVGTVFGHPFFHANVGPIPITADRVLLGVLLLQYAAMRYVGKAQPRPLSKADLVLLLLVAVLTGSTFFHDWRSDSYSSLSTLLFFYLVPVMLYVVARGAQWNDAQLKRLTAVMAVLGVYLAATSIFEMQGWWSLVFPKFVRSAEYAEFFGRGRGPLLNPVGNGIVMAGCFLAAALYWPRLNKPGKVVLIGVLLLGAAGMYGTLTRSVWLGAALAAFASGAMIAPKKWRMPAMAGVLLLGCGVAAAKWEDWSSFKRDEFVSEHDMASSASLRPILATVAWNMFQDRPLFGCGFGQYLGEAKYYLSNRNVELPLEKVRPYVQHNLYLSLLTETGLAGMGLMIVLVGFWSQGAWRLWKQQGAPLAVRQHGVLMLGLIAAWTANAMFHETSLIPMVNCWIFCLAGILQSLCQSWGMQPVVATTRVNRLPNHAGVPAGA